MPLCRYIGKKKPGVTGNAGFFRKTRQWARFPAIGAPYNSPTSLFVVGQVDRNQVMKNSKLPSRLAIWSVVLISAESAFAQQRNGGIESLADAAKILHLEFARITFSNSGDIRIEVEPSVAEGAGTLFHLLTQEAFLNELEVTEKQQRELDDIARRFDQRQAERRPRATSPNRSREEHEQFMQEVADDLEKTLKELDEVLLAHQIQRASQVAFRYSIRTTGLRGTLAREPVQQILGMEIGGLDKIDQQKPAILEYLGTESRKVCDEALAMWLEGLNQEQIDLVKLRWPMLTGEHPEIDILAHWLSQKPETRDSEIDGIRMLAETPEFGFSSDGTFKEQIWLELAGGKDNEGLKVNSIRYAIIEIVSLNGFREQHGITDEQFSGILEIHQSADDASREFSKAQMKDEPLKALLEPAEKDKLRRESKRVRLEMAEQALREIKSALSAGQWTAIAGVGVTRYHQFLGPLHDLVHGELGTMLQLTEADKSRLTETGKKAAMFLKKEGRRIEEGTIEIALRPLGKEFLDRINYLLGEPLEKSNSAVLMIRHYLNR